MYRVLHVLNYAWPFVNGYTVRSMGLIGAQRRTLGWDARCVGAPFGPYPAAQDMDTAGPHWGPAVQFALDDTGGKPAGPFYWERPALGLAPAATRRMRRRLAEVLDTWQPDIVHAHHPWYVGNIAVELARQRDIPAVYEVRCFNGDYDLDKRVPPWAKAYVRARGLWQNQLEYRLCRRASSVVTIADGLAERICSRAGVEPDNVFVVRNSVDPEVFRADSASESSDQVFHIGYATTFAEMEGLDTLVEAVAMARRTLFSGGMALRVTLAGSGEDWSRINDYVQRLGLQDTVDLPGALAYSEMPAFYNTLDLFVVPRRPSALAEHTTPLKPLEALSCGTPVLASEVPALRELLGARPGVRFFDPEPDALAAAIVDAAENRAARPVGAVDDRAWRDEIGRYVGVYEHAEKRHRQSHD